MQKVLRIFIKFGITTGLPFGFAGRARLENDKGMEPKFHAFVVKRGVYLLFPVFCPRRDAAAGRFFRLRAIMLLMTSGMAAKSRVPPATSPV